MPIGQTSDIQAINQRPAAPTPTPQAAAPAVPVVTSKKAALKNPDGLAQLTTAGDAGAGVTLGGTRYGYGPTAATLKAKSTQPIFGIAGAGAGGAQTADAGTATVFPSQFAFPTSKYHNAARLKGMS